jgi:hypothetical protein
VSNYRFQPALDRQKRAGFAALSDTEKWDWHADTYGFRRAFLDVEPDVRTSPCDPTGAWFDPLRANVAETHYRKKFGKPPRSKTVTPPPTPEDIAYVENLLDNTIRIAAAGIKRMPTKATDR